MSIPFSHPFSCVLSGPTGSGKTQFILRFIRHANAMIDPPVKSISYYCNDYQDAFDQFPQVHFRRGLPSTEELENMSECLVVIDDMMNEANQQVCNMFTRGCHHKNISLVFIVQNFFNNNKHMRTISLNAQYIVMFKNIRDASQFAFLARQLFPNNARFAHESYLNATREPFGYLLVDCHPNQIDDDLRLRTKIFPDDNRHFVYVPKK